MTVNRIEECLKLHLHMDKNRMENFQVKHALDTTTEERFHLIVRIEKDKTLLEYSLIHSLLLVCGHSNFFGKFRCLEKLIVPSLTGQNYFFLQLIMGTNENIMGQSGSGILSNFM